MYGTTYISQHPQQPPQQIYTHQPYPAATSTYQPQQSTLRQSARQAQQSPVKQNQEEDLQSNASQSRINYLRRMYLLLFFQLLFATFISNLTEENNDFGTWVRENSFWTFWVSLVILVVIQVVALFKRQLINPSPQNIVFYILHAIAFAFVFASLEIDREADRYVTYFLLFFTTVVFSLYIHVLFAKNEITFQSVALYVLGGVYLLTLIFVIFIDITNMVLYLTAILSTLWGFFIACEYETVIGSNRNWSEEDYFSGAVSVYMSIFVLILKQVDLIKESLLKPRP